MASRTSVEPWPHQFLFGTEKTSHTQPKDEDSVKDEQIKNLKQQVDGLVLSNDLLIGTFETVPFSPEDGRKATLPIPMSRNENGVRKRNKKGYER